MIEFAVETKGEESLVEITDRVVDAVSESRVKDGVCIVQSMHTTAAVTVNENADPDVRADILASLDDIVAELGFRHAEGNSRAHVKTSLIGCSETIIIADGRLQLGRWQGIYFCEFDGPRHRRVKVIIL